MIPLTLVHILKSGSHEIPMDTSAAMEPTAFATYTQTKAGETHGMAFGWRMTSTQTTSADGKKGKYAGHSFEVRMAPEHLQQFIDAAKTALKRFKESA